MTVDAEHIGIRTAMPILAVVGLLGGFILGGIIAPLIDNALSTMCMSLFGAVAGLVILTQIGERAIKPLWHSSRSAIVDTSNLTIIDYRRRPKHETTIQWHHAFDVQAWYFEVPNRKSRVSKGWYCTSVRLIQDQEKLIFYTFMSPEEAQSIPHFSDWFVHLRKKKEREELATSDPHQAAIQDRHRKLEKLRWDDGAELKIEDFLALMNLVARHGQYQ
jgi:hypothetical protein